jgi:O-antigen/teichoic acid export membrane protein
MLRWNLIANYFGQGWSACIGLVFIPVYISYLGIEAYGLIGLFASLQLWLALLDFGLTPTLGREVARHTAGGRSIESLLDIIRTVEFIMLTIGIIVAVCFLFIADWAAHSWLNISQLTTDDVSMAFRIMGIVIATRFIEGIYRSVLLGLQKQVSFNLIFSAFATLRAVGAVCVLEFVESSVELFFLWQALISIFTLLTLLVAAYTSLDESSRMGRFSVVSLKEISSFAGGMLTISITSIMLTQFDKIILSNYVPLDVFGGYMLAATVAGSVFLLITPLTQAFYPKFCRLFTEMRSAELAGSFHTAVQLVTVCAGSVSIVLAMNAEILLLLWTGDEALSAATASVLTLLLVGNFVNGLMWVPYHMQLSHAWTRLSVLGNIFGLVVFLPLIFYALPKFGVIGVAFSWLILSLVLFLGTSHLTFRKILKAEKWEFYLNDICIPLSFGLSVAFLAKIVWVWLGSVLPGLYLIFAFGLTLAASIVKAGRLRNYISLGRLYVLNFFAKSLTSKY